MRQLPGRTWHGKEMVWSVPEESIHADELQQKLESIATVTFEIDTGDVSQEITPEHVTHYISCIAESGVYSSSYQNIAVNAIKFYIETVCGLIRIVQGKGKKDRIVPLSKRLYAMIQEYRKEYQPKTWLFEGQKGGMYTVRSIQSLFHEACLRAKITNSARKR